MSTVIESQSVFQTPLVERFQCNCCYYYYYFFIIINITNILFPGS